MPHLLASVHNPWEVKAPRSLISSHCLALGHYLLLEEPGRRGVICLPLTMFMRMKTIFCTEYGRRAQERSAWQTETAQPEELSVNNLPNVVLV